MIRDNVQVPLHHPPDPCHGDSDVIHARSLMSKKPSFGADR